MAQTTLRDYLQETEDAISSGRIEEALDKCQIVLNHFPQSLEAQRLLGEVYLKQGKLDEAQRAFDWVLTNDPENVVAYCDRALVSERRQDYDTALDCYQQAYELSRGNSQIRNEFNKLCAKTGQQGLMFSRAGLARLYMRGDLLMQSIQEWEAVLAANSDRLDARLGLLEACWRSGQYDQVERQAQQILEEVPDCLKALFLLAHVTAPKNLQRARELMGRAEALDPDLVVAQELFADLFASQSNDPFLPLLRKPPVVLDSASAVLPAVPPTSVQRKESSPSQNGKEYQAALAGDALSHWGAIESWNGEATLTPLPPAQSRAEQDIPIWTSDNIPGFAPSAGVSTPASPLPPATEAAQESSGTWRHFDQSVTVPPDLAAQSKAGESDEPEIETWQEPPVEEEKALSDEMDVTPSAPAGSLEATELWKASLREHDEVKQVPPAWLSMLTQSQGEHGSLSESTPPPSWHGEEQLPELESDLSPPQLRPQSLSATSPSSSTDRASAAKHVQPVTKSVEKDQENTGDMQQLPVEGAFRSWENLEVESQESEEEDEDGLSFGPQWLKALGAQAMDQEEAEQYSHEVAQAEAESAEQQPGTQRRETAAGEQQPAEPAPVPANPVPATPRMGAESATPYEPVSQEDAQSAYLTTLEELEQSLREQGFVSLEPHSLASIAQAEQARSHTEIAESSRSVSLESEEERESYQEDPALSSALTELGNIARQQPVSQSPAEPSSPAPAQTTGQSFTHAPAESAPVQQPDWLAMLAAIPPAPATPPPVPLAQESSQATREESAGMLPESRVEAQPAQPAQPAPQQPEALRERRAPVAGTPAGPQFPQPGAVVASSTPGFTSTFVPQTPADVPSSLPNPAIHSDPLLDSELETTMRRPAIRLQHLQSRQAGPREQAAPAPAARQRPVEHAVGEKAGDDRVSFRERLVRGYHHQLSGEYDDAMREYRLIIKGAPELLGEVVSNLRALLKLAPKYAAGYRVLGDAYMRQGEYLQAMEAYNKALTMARRAKH
ncbi:MAG: tetratricopeptide repeat protein [Ktedonobacteraceae bacterium]|nr:tetratricopeptide repeat protein [Ktedonobacteraceae bacterium]